MSHLDYYRFQAQARGVGSLADVRRQAYERAFIFNQIVLPWLAADRTAPVAELACGHGSFLCWLKEQQFQNLRGVDASPEQILYARQVEAKVDQGYVNEWIVSQPQGHFATLVAIDFVEHISKDDFLKFLRLAHAALAPGGSLILRLPNGDSPFVGMNLFNDITHIWTYTPNCLTALGRMQGFAHFEYRDEGAKIVRDYRWLKLPLARLSEAILKLFFRAATRERVELLSPHLWARLVKAPA